MTRARFVVCSTRGIESELDLVYAGVAELISPLVNRLELIPAAQAVALRSALALGPPAEASGFAVAIATLSLLATVASDTPVVIAVDDAQWLDSASARVLSFVARRVGGEGVLVVACVRSDETCPLDFSEGASFTLTGLDGDAAAVLLDGNPRRPVSRRVVDDLVTATNGNPLALQEVAAALPPRQLDGSAALLHPLPIGARLEPLYRRRIVDLPEPARRALVVAAANDTTSLAEFAAASTVLGIDGAALDTAADAGLVTIGENDVQFRHPLMRSAAYHSAPLALRRAAHRALAQTLAGEHASDRSVWHRAAATPVPDEQVASLLDAAGQSARRRGGYVAAARAFERAGQLSIRTDQRAQRLLTAARMARLSGDVDRSSGLLDDALVATDDPRLRADIEGLRGVLETWSGDVARGYRRLTGEAARVAPIDPGRASALLVEATMSCVMAGDAKTALTTAQRAVRFATRASTNARVSADAALGVALVLRGRAPDGYPLIRQLVERLERSEPMPLDTDVHARFVQILCWKGDYDRARRCYLRLIEASRTHRAPGALLPLHLALLAQVERRQGRWWAATASATEAVPIARATAQRSVLASALVALAWVQAGRGMEQLCRSTIAEARDLVDRCGLGTVRSSAHAALGFLELGHGRIDAAIASLEVVAHLVRRQGIEEPSVIWWAPDLVEAYVRTCDRPRAEAAYREFEGLARRTGNTWALASAARCRGLLADDDVIDEVFAEALRLHDEVDAPFELARTALCYGERLRRRKDRAAARVQLHAALSVFEDLGARPWAQRVTAELAATGEVLDARPAFDVDRLTPQELQVATAIADGASNKAAASALFVSTKTIEFHLSNIYRKLGVRSRSQLTRVLLHRSSPG